MCNVASRSRVSRSIASITASKSNATTENSSTQTEKLAKRGNMLRLAIFLSEYLFIALIILICVRYSNYELEMQSSPRVKLASVILFSGNIILHVYCFIFTVVKPLITFKEIYYGGAQSTKNLKFQAELELQKYTME